MGPWFPQMTNLICGWYEMVGKRPEAPCDTLTCITSPPRALPEWTLPDPASSEKPSQGQRFAGGDQRPRVTPGLESEVLPMLSQMG